MSYDCENRDIDDGRGMYEKMGCDVGDFFAYVCVHRLGMIRKIKKRFYKFVRFKSRIYGHTNFVCSFSALFVRTRYR